MNLLGIGLIASATVVAAATLVFEFRETPSVTPIWEVARKARYAFEDRVQAEADPVFAPTYIVKGGSGGNRVYLLHGLRADKEYWNEDPHSALTSGLLDQHFEVISADLPYAKGVFFADGGAKYCQAVKTWFADLRSRVDQDHGQAAREIIIGESWGGYNALIAAALTSEKPLDGVAAIRPVVDISRLSEFWTRSNSGCDPLILAPRLSHLPVFLFWGENDMRVDERVTVNLVDRLRSVGAKKLTTEFDQSDHTATAAQYVGVLKWAAQTVGSTPP